MLPIIINETTISPFKFWFENSLKDGLHHKDELYCRVVNFPAKERARAYHLGCQMSQNGSTVILTLSTERCGIWVSLRDPVAQAILSGRTPLVLPGMGIAQEI